MYISRMTNRCIPSTGNLAVRAIWYVFFSNIKHLRQCGLYGAVVNLQEITVLHAQIVSVLNSF
jgi:hypothetical protein